MVTFSPKPVMCLLELWHLAVTGHLIKWNTPFSSSTGQHCLLCLWASQVALVIKNTPASAGDAKDACSIPGLGRSPGGRYGNPLQYSCLENPHGQRSLAGYRPWGHKQSDMTEQHSTLLSLLLSCLIYLSPWWSIRNMNKITSFPLT